MKAIVVYRFFDVEYGCGYKKKHTHRDYNTCITLYVWKVKMLSLNSHTLIIIIFLIFLL